MILCNSNGGFYEYSLYQTEWLEFYLDAGVSVMLWNYRGYGRSAGKPDLERIKKDGEVLVNYARTQKNTAVLGVHGESLGGCIATYVAKECVLDFLVADRTFSSIPTLTFFKFGKIVYWIYKLACGDNSDCISDYLNANCFKILMSDPNDAMIDDLASLKSAVALKLLSPDISILQLGYLQPKSLLTVSHIITPSALLSCVESIGRLKNFLDCLSENKPYKATEYFQRIGKGSYQPIHLETDGVLEESLPVCLDRLFAAISKINAGGKSFPCASEGKHGRLGLIIWLMTLDIWGSSVKASEEMLSSHMKAVNTIRGCLQEMQEIQEEYEKSENVLVKQVFKDINTIFNVLIEILGFLEERCGISSDLDETINRPQTDYQKAGILIPVHCGHSGLLNPAEKYLFSKHLLNYLSSSPSTTP